MPSIEARHAPSPPSSSSRAKSDDDANLSLLASICHDLREPLSSIAMGSSYLIKELGKVDVSADTAAKSRKMAEAIRRAADRMNRLVEDFHDLSLLERGLVHLELGIYDAGALLDFAAEELAPWLRDHDTQLELGPPTEQCAVRADRARFVQVLEKLVQNAREASAPGALVTVRAAPSVEGVVFQVVDSGHGIDETTRAHLFDYRWHATRRARKSAGLGLGVARGLILAQGGDLRLESTGPSGTTLAFTLPNA